MSLLAIRNLTKTYAVTPPVEVLRGLNLEVCLLYTSDAADE